MLHFTKCLLGGWVLLATLSGLMAEERTGESVPAELKRLSIEELMNVEVTSAARKPQRLATVASALDVMTSEEIRRSGALQIPDLLRLSTGLHVAQVDGHTWGISARGFNLTTANKMHVLMDGRSLYTPLFAGVFWDVQDTFLEDLEQIEVIRGPGSTMWGANAVNGVINIVTKRAQETQGTLVFGGGGMEERGFGGVRYGGRLGEKTYYRAYAKAFSRDDLTLRGGGGAKDDWRMGQTGFRLDSELSEQNLITAQGDLYYGEVGQLTEDDIELAGGNLLGRWTHVFSENSDLQWVTYYDRTDRSVPRIFEEERNTWDTELQHRFKGGERHEWVWGLNYRVSLDEVDNPSPQALGFFPDGKTIHLVSGFVQDEITLIEERLGLMLGAKLEHNDFSGFEIQPSARAAWTPTSRHTLWSAVSRAVRTPSRIDHHLRIPGLIREDDGFGPEELVAYEIGYRFLPHDRVSVDVAAFYDVYDNLRSQEPLPSGERLLRNKLEGETYGIELAAKYQLTDWWRLQGSYTFLEKDLDLESDSMDPTGGAPEGNDPRHLFSIHSMMNLTANWEFDWIIRFVDTLPEPHVPNYMVMDLRLAWRLRPNLELAVIGRNLLDDRHPEFGRNNALRKEIQHSAYGKLTWSF